MAEKIQDALGFSVHTIPGDKGEFSLRVDGKVVAAKHRNDFPSPAECIEVLRRHVEPSTGS